jgi:hypothetical protein
MYEE